MFVSLLSSCALYESFPAFRGEPEGETITDFSINLISPESDVFTNSTVGIQVGTSHEVESVSLSIGGEVVQLEETPFNYDWDTTGFEERDYEVFASTELDSKTYSTDSIMVTVDRTPPSIVSRVPSPNADAQLGIPLEVEFSEPIFETQPFKVTTALGPVFPIPTSDDGTRFSFETSWDASQTVAVEVAEVTDRAGNTADTEAWNVNYPTWIRLQFRWSFRPTTSGFRIYNSPPETHKRS